MGALTSAGSTEKAGDIKIHAANAIPTGWLKANGAAVSRTLYAALFASIGTTYGVGDGATTFNLPDLRGEFMRVFDDGRGVDAARVMGSWQGGEIGSHTHSVTTGGSFSALGGRAYGQANDTVSSMNTGAYGGSETRPRNVAMLACIRY